MYSDAVYLANLHKVLGVENLTDDLVSYFSEEVDKIIQKNKIEKKLITIVNALIQDEINDENKYAIEDDRQLDDAEYRRINAKILDVFGEKTWDEFEELEREEYANYIAHWFRN